MKCTRISFLTSLTAVASIAIASCSLEAQTISPEAASKESATQTQVQVALPDELQWQDSPGIPGAQSARAIGDPSAAQMYAVITKMTAGTVASAHVHPDDRITTVLSGVMYYGTGEEYSRDLVQPYPAGSVIFTPAGTPHFMWTESGQTIAQEAGVGPTGMDFVSQQSVTD